MICRHVDVCNGVNIIGNVTISDHAYIGANAVILTDIQIVDTAVGNSAKVEEFNKN